MPIVTLTKDNKTRYYAVNDADEISLDALAHDTEHYQIAETSSREYAEHALRREYLKRLTEHAYDCAHLAHLIEHPPDDETPTALNPERLAKKIATSAVWLRSYEPFTALTADVVGHENDEYGTALVLSENRVTGLYDDRTWSASSLALMDLDPWRRDNEARIAREKAEKEAERELTPAAQKRVAKAWDEIRRASKLTKVRAAANKTVRRAKRSTKRRAA